MTWEPCQGRYLWTHLCVPIYKTLSLDLLNKNTSLECPRKLEMTPFIYIQ